MAISNVVRVRSDGLSNSIPMWRPFKASAVGASRPSERSAFTCARQLQAALELGASKSRIERKSLRLSQGGINHGSCPVLAH
jgi:hypothetical protein